MNFNLDLNCFKLKMIKSTFLSLYISFKVYIKIKIIHMIKRKRHFCGECKKYYSSSSSFSKHVKKKHGLPQGQLPLNSITPRTSNLINYPFLC